MHVLRVTDARIATGVIETRPILTGDQRSSEQRAILRTALAEIRGELARRRSLGPIRRFIETAHRWWM